MELVFRNARIVDALNGVNAMLDLGIEDGKVAAIAPELPEGKSEVDCAGKTIIPGVIDMHVHVTGLLGGHVGYRMAAKTGVTTVIDFAGPVQDIVAYAGRFGCGMNVGCVDTLHPGYSGSNPSEAQVADFLEQSLEWGSLGLKLLGGHFPLTPEASLAGVQAANARRVIVACHAGSTRQRSDILGMREAVEWAKGYRMILAHINAYCRGKHLPYLEEVQEAFHMLRENPNIIADSHMAIMNGTSGLCRDGVPCDFITINCLKMFGRDPTEDGLGKSILDGLVRVIAPRELENSLLGREEAFDYWRAQSTNANVSFPANLPAVAAACMLERRTPGGEFLIPLAATDGGGFPRNNLIGKLLSLYHLGYLSLEEIIRKASLYPAQVFGLSCKGHLAVGADADMTVLNSSLTGAVESYVQGRQIMREGIITGSGAQLITTEAGRASASRHNLPCVLTDLSKSAFYSGAGFKQCTA